MTSPVYSDHLLFATHNEHKSREVRAILSGKWEIQSLADIQFVTPVPETGHTLEENAIQKALFVLNATGRDCFAEDTGLEVAALDGAPGVFTARYSGENATPQTNMDKLLKALEGKESREACFKTVIALCWRGEVFTFFGEVSGTIAKGMEGLGGFGYDPVFIPHGFTQTFGELPPEIKKEISHRARALAQFQAFLEAIQLQ